MLADELDLDFGAERDLDFWRSAAARTSGAILELGCGGGRILAALGGGRELIGVDLDAAALELAVERLPAARLCNADARIWRSSDPLAAGLVIIGGDLLPLIIDDGGLVALFTTAAQHVASIGLVGIDATRMDPALLAAAAVSPGWEIDIERPALAGRSIRESKITVDPAGRGGVALLEVRHRAVGSGGPSSERREPFPIRAWGEGELLTAVESAGLERIEALDTTTRFRWLLRPHATLGG